MSQVHVIIGEDDYLVSEAASKIIGDGEGLEVVDSLCSTNAELQLADLREADASLSTPPFLFPKKVTWWKNVGFLPRGGGKAAAADVTEALLKFAKKLANAELPEGQHFILSGPKLHAASEMAKTLKASVEVIVFDPPKKGFQAAKAATVRAIDIAAESGLEFERGAAEAFAARVGCDARSLASEIGKMRDYLGKDRKVITIADIAEVTSQGVGVEPMIWELTDALGARDLKKTLAANAKFEGDGGYAVFVTSVVEKFFRELVELKDAAAKGKFESACEGMSAWAVDKKRAMLSKWTLLELRMARFRFLALRERAVSSAGRCDLLVAMELARACRRRGKN